MAGNGGGEFRLPEEILSVMPTDPYDQLDLARRIASLAITYRVSGLEAEAARLRRAISDRDLTIAGLRNGLSRLDRLFQESGAHLRATVEENVSPLQAELSRERDLLDTTAKTLAIDLSRQPEAVDIGTYKQSAIKMSTWKDEGSVSSSRLDLVSGLPETKDSTKDAPRHAMHQFFISPDITPWLTPTSIPKVSSTGGSPRVLSPPRVLSGTTSPAKYHFKGHGALSSRYVSNQQSSRPSSPPPMCSVPGHTTSIDGRELFCQARRRLSYEQFAAFLSNVKGFNAQKQSREETLERAEEIFGTENKDLYLSFKGLFNWNLP